VADDRHTDEDGGAGVGRLSLELLGLAAGIAIFVNYVGTLVVRARLEALRLPADSVLGLLPAEQFVAAGLELLIPSAVLGLVVLALVAVLGLTGTERSAWLTTGSRIVLGAAGLLIVGGVLAIALAEPSSPGKHRLAVAVALAVAALTVLTVLRGRSLRGIGATLFGVLALLSAVLGYLRASDPPVDLDFAVLTMKDGVRTSGFLLGRSSDSVVLAPDADARTISRVAVIPRGDVVDLRVAPGPQGGVRPLDLDYPVVGGELPRPPGRDVRLLSQRYLAGVRGSTLWKYPPIMFGRSIGLWQHHYREFAAQAPQPWSAHGVRVGLAELNQEPTLFENKFLITGGRLVAVTRPLRVDEGGRRGVLRQILVVQSADARFRAVCGVASQHAFATGSDVELRGIVVAAGLVVDGSGTERGRVALLCSAARVRDPPTRRASPGSGS
jgi:hypothetical protein